MSCDTVYVVHARLTRRDVRGGIVQVVSLDQVTYAVNAWKARHPDVEVGATTLVTEGIDAYAGTPSPPAGPAASSRPSSAG
jgi:hypothetical protein